MKSIGIKLADGSFYPLLEEGNPEKRTLDLTTVMDNQTKVQVEVYRTETGTMENAEYLDTLEITNLKPHENGEPTLCLAIDVDENNELSAEIKDPETGKTSEIQVTLHSRTLAGLSQNSIEPEEESSDVIISDDDLEKAGLDDFMEKKEFDSEEIPLPAEDFSFDDVNEPAKADDTIVPQEENAAEEIFSGNELDLPDFGNDDGETFIDENELNLDESEETMEEPAAEENPEPQEEVAEDSTEETIIPENETPDIFDGTDEPEEDEEEILSEPLIEETPEDDILEEETESAAEEADENTVVEEDSNETDFSADLPDFDDDLNLDGSIDLNSEETVDDTTLDLGTEDLSLPDFDDLDTQEEKGGDIFAENDSSSDLDLQLPDFDDLEATDLDSPVLGDSDDNDSLFDLPDFDDEQKDSLTDGIEDFTLPPDFDTSFSEEPMTSEEKPKNPTFAPSNSLFSNLYDKETLEGTSSSYDFNDEDDVKKSTKAPVIICIICAIICIIAVLLTLFVIPSKLNILSIFSRNGTQTVEKEFEDAAEEQEVPEEELPALPEKTEAPAKVEIVVEETAPAKEDAIVVAEIPTAIVPAEPESVVEKIPDIRYKIVWGDTLWDISTAYYKTPWKYKKIAKYNKIRNPDHIISGTYILIPAE